MASAGGRRRGPEGERGHRLGGDQGLGRRAATGLPRSPQPV